MTELFFPFTYCFNNDFEVFFNTITFSLLCESTLIGQAKTHAHVHPQACMHTQCGG
jgi:hypothetical protein